MPVLLVLGWQSSGSLGLPALEQQSLELAQRQPSAANWQKLALTRYLQNKFVPAIEAFRLALQSDASLWTSHLFLGVSLYRTNQFSEAVASLEKAARLAPASGQGRDDVDYWLGASYIARREPLRGLQWLERLLVRNPRHREALQLATETYAETASGIWSRIAERAFDSSAGQEVHGYALESEGNRQGAEEAWARARELAPGRSGPGTALGKIHLRAGELSAAREALERELRIDPTAPEANLYAGLLALQENRPAEAEKPLQIALSWMPENEEPALALCQAYLALGKAKEAVLAAQHAVQVDESSEAAHELLLASLAAAQDGAGLEKEKQRWETKRRGR